MTDIVDKGSKIHIEEAIQELHPVALIGYEHNYLAKLCNISFLKAVDDFFNIDYALLPLPSGKSVALIDRENSPEPGTEISVRQEEKNIVEVIQELLYAINLSVENLTWVHPDYENDLYKSNNTTILLRENRQANYPQKFAGEDFSGLALRKIDFENSNLKGANFKGADISKANFKNANLEGANLSETDLRNTNLEGANLSRSNLQSADLRGANLSRSNLQSADLTKADLQRANLRGATLSYSNLNEASFKDADLEDAILYDIHWTPTTMWFHVIGLHKANKIPLELRNQTHFTHSLALSKAADKFRKNKNLDELRESYLKIIRIVSEPEILASLWNKFAWISALYGNPDEQSLEAAEKAVKIGSDKVRGNYHDTYGIILAFRRHFDESIKEFEIALDSEDTKRWSEDFRQRRQKWITKMRYYEYPFTDEDLKKLMDFEY